MQRISQRLTQRIKELAERYEFTLSELSGEVETLEKKVIGHLEKMGYRILINFVAKIYHICDKNIAVSSM